MISEAEGRLAAILRRELGAVDVRFLRSGEPSGASETVLACPVPDGPTIVAHFDEPPADREAKARRMEMIVGSFADLMQPPHGDAARHPPHRHASPARSLAGELSGLAVRAAALSALVVDARSPVIWGASDVHEPPDDGPDETEGARLFRKAARDGLHFIALVSAPLLDTEVAHGAEGGGAENDSAVGLAPDERAELWRRVLLVRNALAAVRALPHVTNLHRGEHLHHTVRTRELSYVVRSFATIYMLVLVFDAPFDELRAERSVTHALPTIERLVLALPPTEPTPPTAGVGVVRGRRR